MRKQVEDFYCQFRQVSAYIDYRMRVAWKEKYASLYQRVLVHRKEEIIFSTFCHDYEHLEELLAKQNEFWIQKELRNVDFLLSHVNGYSLDENQRRVVLTDEVHQLVIAGAGSGKSLTIIGKIRYLVEYLKIPPQEIIVLSFTNDSTKSLKMSIDKQLQYPVQIYTFHKLALQILKENSSCPYTIAPADLLEYLIDEYFQTTVFLYPKMMKSLLRYLGISTFPFSTLYGYRHFLSPEELKLFQKLIVKFIRLFKTNAYNESDFIGFFEQNKKFCSLKKYGKQRTFLRFAYLFYHLYEHELSSQGEIDFDDMIKLATKSVLKKGMPLPCRYLIIDEYQDSSLIRVELVQAILERTQAKFMAVGDDFQSIYRFTGCDLAIFLHFERYFPHPAVMKIENTYRNSQELVTIAGNFVMKNSSQLQKNLSALKHLERPIRLVYYQNAVFTFKRVIKEIHREFSKGILVLGRNNRDIYASIDHEFRYEEKTGKLIYLPNPKISLRYLTVHKSKGLEEENVILLHVAEGKMGFPNQIADHDVLKFVSLEEENYRFSEERRLFYVALTRTKNYIYLLAPKGRESCFVRELVHDYSSFITVSTD